MRVNEQIREKEIRLIGENGENLGIVSIETALAQAKDRRLDLVEIASATKPSVCKIIDYGKHQYRQEKRQRKQKRQTLLKEIKFTIKIGNHDFETKMRRVHTFLSAGNQVRVSIFFRGREIVHANRGHALMDKVAERVSDIAKVDHQPTQKGKVLQMLLVPTAQEN